MTMQMQGSMTIGRQLAALMASAVVASEQEITYLLDDTFVGAAGSLDLHDPSGYHLWDNWTSEGHTGSDWQLDGSGGVSQIDYPTGGEGTRNYHAHIYAASNEALVKGTFTSPATNTWITGVMIRRNNEGNFWAVRLNANNNRLEIFEVIAGSGAVRDFVAFTTAQNTQYTIEAECYGTTIVARIGATSCDFTSSTNQTKFSVGLYEAAILNGGHSRFTRFTVEHSPQATLPVAGRFFYAPAVGSVATEWGDEANSGVADTGRNITYGAWEMEIDTTLGTSGTRLQFQCYEASPVPTANRTHASKNLPDRMWFTTYIWIPQLIQRVSGFWLLMQAKYRDSDTTSWPAISFNLGWNGSAMVTEINNNVGADGSYSPDEPDLSEVNYEFPVAQWVRVDMYYQWSNTTNGRMRLFMDNVELYDFTNIRTVFSSPAEGWGGVGWPRVVTVAHYASNLNPANTTIFMDNVSVNVGDRLPDDYPVSTPA